MITQCRFTLHFPTVTGLTLPEFVLDHSSHYTSTNNEQTDTTERTGQKGGEGKQ